MLAVGGVDYDQDPKPLDDPAVRTELLALRRAETERGRGPGEGDGDGWKSLPGTGREVEAVAKLAGSRPLLRLQGDRGQHGAAAPRAAPSPLGPHRHPRLLRRPQGPLHPPARSQALRLRGPPAGGGAAQPAGPLGAGPGRGQPARRRRRAGRPVGRRPGDRHRRGDRRAALAGPRAGRPLRLRDRAGAWSAAARASSACSAPSTWPVPTTSSPASGRWTTRRRRR